MRRLGVRARRPRGRAEDLSPEMQAAAAPGGRDLRAALRQRETELVRDALERHGGVQARAAAELGITRQALWAKIRRLGLVDAGP